MARRAEPLEAAAARIHGETGRRVFTVTADIRKAGSAFDLPIAVGILAATGMVKRRDIAERDAKRQVERAMKGRRL